MTFNYNFQTDDDLISQKWNDAKIGNSAKNSKNQNSKNSPNSFTSQTFQNSKKSNFSKNFQTNFQTTIRKAQNSDAEVVVQINKNSWIKTYPNKEFGITEADILALNWEKNLEKAQNNPEYGKNLWLLEIDLGNPKINLGNITSENLKLEELKPKTEIEKETEKFTENFGKNETLETKIEIENNLDLENQKKVVGFVRFFKNEEDLNEIKAIYIDPEFVSLGFGTELMIFAIQNLGFEQNWTVKAASYNHNAIEFYQKFGFKILDKKIENFQLTGEKSIPQVQMIANKDKLQKKIAEIKLKLEKSGDLENNSENNLKNGLQNKETWTILTPPPNLTGNLHAGHALEHFIMDSLSRRERQDGKQVLYYPGIDHAGIQLEGVINKLIGKGEFDDIIESKLNQKSCEIDKNNSDNLTKISEQKSQNKNQNLEKIDLTSLNLDTENGEDQTLKNVKRINLTPKKTYSQNETGILKNLEKVNLEMENRGGMNSEMESEIRQNQFNSKVQNLEKPVNPNSKSQTSKQNYQNFLAQKSEDRANWLKKNFAEIWLECAWSKVNLWRDNQKNQSLILGDSPDWDKQLFTLDDRAVDMVNLAFENYWRDGLIYRDSYMINWSVALQTALSDVPEDIGRMEKVDPFVTFIYQVAEIKTNFESNLENRGENENEILAKLLKLKNLQIMVSTVRIETVFADVAVAIHPEKFAEFFGFEKSETEILKNWLNSSKVEIILEIPPLKVKNVKLIIDETVDLSFGTGCLKTQKHNFTSFAQAIGRNGKLTEICGEFSGLTVEKARTLILKRLLETGFIPNKKPKIS